MNDKIKNELKTEGRLTWDDKQINELNDKNNKLKNELIKWCDNRNLTVRIDESSDGDEVVYPFMTSTKFLLVGTISNGQIWYRPFVADKGGWISRGEEVRFFNSVKDFVTCFTKAS